MAGWKRRLPLDRFSAAVDRVLIAESYADLEAVMTKLPPPVRVTRSGRCLAHPLKIDAGAGHLDLGSGWQPAAGDVGADCHGEVSIGPDPGNL